MLVLTRKSEESIILGGDIEIKVLGIRGDQVSLGFKAPHSVSIYRKEVYDAIEEENRRGALAAQDELETIRRTLRGRDASSEAGRRRAGTEDS